VAKYRKKPVVIEAHRFVDGVWAGNGVPEWYTEAFMANRIMHHGEYRSPPTHATIETLEGTMRADVGDWIIRGVKGEFYPCKSDIFEITYDKVVD
jgi:hypothetical protein